MEDLENLRTRKAQLEARIAQLQARDRMQKRRRETRAKIILGGVAHILAQRDIELMTTLAEQIPKLVPERDRKLVFELLRE